MEKILVPCDFSDAAVQAFRFALDIARQSDGEIILLSVLELPVMYDSDLMPTLNFEESFLKEMKASAGENFKKIKARWAKGGPKVSLVVEYGAISLTIARVAEQKAADLIVMGTKGASGLKEFFVGSNTEKLVRSSEVPVIAVKKYVKISAIKNIVFPNALGKGQEELLMRVKQLQEFLNARLHILFVNTPASFRQDRETRHQLRDFAKRFMLKDYTLNIFNDLDQESGVRNFTHQIGADMIAMATHGRRGLNHLMSGSIAEDVVNHIDCPIWTSVEK